MITVILPFIIPLFFGVITGVFRKAVFRKQLVLVGLLLHVAACAFLLWTSKHGAIRVVNVGEWLSPYGIVLIADLFASIFLFAISLIFFAVSLYRLGDEQDHSVHLFHFPLIFILQAGISLCLLTADLFNMFVSFEMMLTASYALIVLDMRSEHLKWAFSYLIVNLIGTLGFLCAVAMIYGHTGHLNIAALAEFMKKDGGEPLIQGWAYLLLGIFGLKAGLFPLYFWLPSTYSYLSPSLVALFSGSLTKIGIYILIRIFVVLLPGPLTYMNDLILIVSCLTMLLGALGAISCSTIRGILSYHIISQIGYMMLGLALYTPIAIASALIFIIHNIWVKVSLFLIGGVAMQAFNTDRVKDMGNLSLTMPWLAGAFFLQALSLTGFPPLSGFWGKYFIVSESLRSEHYMTAGVALFTSWFTLFSMLKIWIGVFWKHVDQEPVKRANNLKEQSASIALLVLASILFGLGIEPVYQTAKVASVQIFKKEAYIEAILQTGGKGIL